MFILKKVKGVFKIRKKPKEKYISEINTENWKRFFNPKTSILRDHCEFVIKERDNASDIEGSGDEYDFKYWMETFFERKVGLTKTIKELSPETIKSNRRHIGDYYEWCLQHDATSKDIMNHVDNGFRWFETYYQQRMSGEWTNPKTKKKWSASTIGIGHRNVRGFYNFIADRSTIGFPHDILKRLRIPKATNERDGLNPHEFKLVMDWILKNRQDEFWGKFILMLRLQFKTGMRVGELCKIKNGNIDLNNKSIKIVGKGSKSRMLYFQSEGDNKIWEDITTKMTESPYLFYRTRVQFYPKQRKKIEVDVDTSKPTTESYYTQRFRQMRDVLGLRSIITSHSLRRYFITTFVKETGNADLVQQIVGHESKRMVEHYIGNMIQEDTKTTIDLPI